MIEDDQFARLDVADEFGADDVQRTGLRRDDPGSAGQPAENQRADTQRIPHADDRVLGQRHQGIGTLDLAKRVDDPLFYGGIKADGDQMDDHLGVGRRLEQATAPHQLLADGQRIGQVAVVADGQAAELEVGEQRLHIAQHGVAGRRVSDMANGHMAGQRLND